MTLSTPLRMLSMTGESLRIVMQPPIARPAGTRQSTRSKGAERSRPAILLGTASSTELFPASGALTTRYLYEIDSGRKMTAVQQSVPATIDAEAAAVRALFKRAAQAFGQYAGSSPKPTQD